MPRGEVIKSKDTEIWSLNSFVTTKRLLSEHALFYEK